MNSIRCEWALAYILRSRARPDRKDHNRSGRPLDKEKDSAERNESIPFMQRIQEGSAGNSGPANGRGARGLRARHTQARGRNPERGTSDASIKAGPSEAGPFSAGQIVSSSEDGHGSSVGNAQQHPPQFDLNVRPNLHPELNALIEQMRECERACDRLQNLLPTSSADLEEWQKALFRVEREWKQMESGIDECLDLERHEELNQEWSRHRREMQANVDPTLLRRFEEQQARRRAFEERLPLLEKENMAQFNRDRRIP